MSLNNTPSAERTHIGIFGRTNAGKSSLINALTGQNLAIVSDVKGTTTDPVLKAMELLPLGPVVMIDTPGLDDEGTLGNLRIQKAYQMLNKTDIAVLVLDGQEGLTPNDAAILKRILDKGLPYVIVMNKADLVSEEEKKRVTDELLHKSGTDISVTNGTAIIPERVIWVSATSQEHIYELKELIARLVPDPNTGKRIVADLIKPLDFVVLVIPIDSSAPKGRLILPQQQTIRDILEAGAVSIAVRETELKETLARLDRKPDLVITDSQAFAQVSADTPEDIPLTSFSILFARYKGNLKTVVKGAHAIDALEDGDTILISEGCTHHRQCEDIGTVKLPNWLKQHTGKELHFEFTSGTEFPLNLDKYKLIIHCGGCTLNEREMKYRLKCAEDAKIPMTNYGTAIAHMKGILDRSTAIFKDLL
jgi:[FeFe] hydrogenase H-cluster maturation GTPase HydF